MKESKKEEKTLRGVQIVEVPYKLMKEYLDKKEEEIKNEYKD